MSVVVFGAPPYVPPAPALRWVSHSMVWKGADGSEWGLSDPSSGIVMLRDGVTGLHLPAWDRWTSESPATAGSRFRGTRVTAREITWAVHVWSDVDSADWLARDRAFWKSFSPDTAGTWEVTAPDGQVRSIDCRLTSDGGYEYGHLPTANGWATYPVNLVADSPFWRGETVSRSWLQGDPVEFFDAEGSPAFHISATQTIDDAEITNPGDVSAWPVWTIEGPVEGAPVTVTVGGGTISIPDMSAGETLVIDTDPTSASAKLDGVEVGHLIEQWNPRPIPAGGASAITVVKTQMASLRCEITPRYYRGI